VQQRIEDLAPGFWSRVMARTIHDPTDLERMSSNLVGGDLGGAGLGGGLGLTLFGVLPEHWMTGAVMGALFMLCMVGLLFVPDVKAHRATGGPAAAVRGVFRDIWALGRTKGGLLAGVICFMPLGTGAAQGVLTQSAVADYWHATATHVAWVQGYTAAGVTAAGCFLGGWLCDRLRPRVAYAIIGFGLAVVATFMALGPATVLAYVIGNLVYALGVGLAYAAFTAVVLNAIGTKSGATKYNLYASLSNFPIWWLGLVLGRVADKMGPRQMLLTEAAFGVLAVVIFAVATRIVSSTELPDALVEA
jgi:hypothetical protein